MIRRRPDLTRTLLAASVACLLAVALRNLGLVSPVLPRVWDNLYYLTEGLAVAVCGLRVRRTRGAERAAWVAVASGLSAYAAGDVYSALVLSGMDAPPFPSPADAGYLSIYPAGYAALVLLLRARAGGVSPTLWLDGIVGGLAIAAVGAVLVFGVVAGTDGSLATVATNLAYPLGDLTMVAFVVAVMTVTGVRAGSTWALLAMAFAVWAIADSTYLYQTAVGTYREYTPLDTAWPLCYVLVAFAASRPATRLDARRVRSSLLVLPALMTCVALAVLVCDHYMQIHDVALWLACTSVAVAIARFALTFRENLRLLGVSELEATTDALTGLGNRRALLRDLEHARFESAGPRLLALFDLDGFKAYNDTFGHLAGDALLARLGRTVAAAAAGSGRAYRMGGDEFCLLSDGTEEDADALLAAAAAALCESGEHFSVSCSYGAVTLRAEALDPVDALRTADQRMYAAKRGGRRSSEEAVHQVLLRVAAEHDGALRDHVDDVAQFAERVGRELGLGPAELVELRRAAELHDIGKVAIPDAILHAPRALDATEWTYMRQHTIIGQRIINAAPELQDVALVVRSSHERWDGGGYPDGLAGEEIPLGARIVAVCDAYDAMVTTRAYRPARAPQEALAELRGCAGTQFDPRVVAAFAAAVDRPRAAEFAPAG